MPNFDFNEIVKKTYKKESTDIKDTEYYESLKVCKNLEKPVSVEENKDDNCAKDDKAVSDESNNLKDILSNLTSIVAIIAAFYAGFSRLTNALYSINAERFYKISSDLFYSNRNFEFVVSISIYAFTIFVLISPLSLRDKWRNKKIHKEDSFLFSALISFYLLSLFIIIFANYIAKIFAKRSILFINFVMLGVFVLVSWFFYFLITGTFKFWVNENEKSDKSNESFKTKSDNNVTITEKIIYGIYIIFIIGVSIVFNFIIKGPDINPKDKISYEILKDEKTYNVVIGYKDDMAITMTSEKAGDSDNKILRFESNEYKLQDLKDKVIVYKTFEDVLPFKQDVEKNEKSKRIKK